MKKILFVCTLLFLGIVCAARAQDDAVLDVNLQNSSVVANVNVYNIEAHQTNRRGIRIAFDIVNDGNTVEPNIKYAAELNSVNMDKNGVIQSEIVDSFVFKDVVSINSRETIHKEVDYQAPLALSGEFYVGISARKESGLPLASNIGKKILLKKIESGVEIDNRTCKIISAANETFTLFDGAIVNKNAKDLKLSCDLLNNSSRQQTFIPKLITIKKTEYGDVVNEKNLLEEKMNAREKKNFTFSIPVENKSGWYVVKFALYDKNIAISNSINVRYMVRGVSGSIENLQLDKDFYKKGDEINASLLFSVMSSFIFSSQSATGGSQEQLFAYDLKIKNKNGEVCSSQDRTVFSNKISGKRILANLKSAVNCFNPVISASLYDDSGNVLDRENFEIETKSIGFEDSAKNSNEIAVPVENNASQEKDYEAGFFKSFYAPIAAAAILVIIALGYGIFRKRKGLKFFLYALFFAGAPFLFTNNASALTLTMDTPWAGVYSYATFTLAKSRLQLYACNTADRQTNITIRNLINLAGPGGFRLTSKATGDSNSVQTSLNCTSSPCSNGLNGQTYLLSMDNDTEGNKTVPIESTFINTNRQDLYGNFVDYETGSLSYEVLSEALSCNGACGDRNFSFFAADQTDWLAGSAWCEAGTATFPNGTPAFPSNGMTTVNWGCNGVRAGDPSVSDCHAGRLWADPIISSPVIASPTSVNLNYDHLQNISSKQVNLDWDISNEAVACGGGAGQCKCTLSENAAIIISDILYADKSDWDVLIGAGGNHIFDVSCINNNPAPYAGTASATVSAFCDVVSWNGDCDAECGGGHILVSTREDNCSLTVDSSGPACNTEPCLIRSGWKETDL